MVPLFALLVLAGCSSEPTESLRDGPTALVASPTQLFVELGGIKTVEVGSVDAQGNPIDLNYEVTETGAGITVRRDSTFLPIFVDDSTLQAPAVGPRFKFIVEGTAYAASSFTVSAGGLAIEVPVNVVPQTGFAGTFDKPVAVLGDTITLTAAPGTAFTETAELRLPGVADTIPLHPIIVARGENGTSLSFLAPPNVNGPLTITEVTSVSAPDLVFSPTTDATLETPLIDTVDVTFSTVTPTLAQTVTMTVQEPLINLVVDSIIFPGQLPGREGDPQNIVVAADSNSLTFDAPPNAAGSGTVVNFAFPGGYLLALPTRPSVTAPSIGLTLDAAISNETPALLEAVTLTAPAGFTFDADTTNVTIGGNLAITQSIAGNQVTVLPIPGSAGVASIDGVVPDAAPDNILTMLTVGTITVPALTPLEGTETPETAPELAVPTAGNSIVTSDAGAFVGEPTDCCFGFHPRIYKLVIAAPTTLSFNLDWFEGQDLGAYITTDDLATVVGAADAAGEGPTGHPESTTIVFAAGTYYVNLVNFSATAPSFFQLTISNP